MNNYFTSNTYHTPEDTPRALIDRLSFKSSWGFHLLFLKTVFRSWYFARQGIYSHDLWVKTSHDIFRDIERCGGRFHIEGFDNLRRSPDPAVIVSNHMSTLETMIFPCVISSIKPITFIIKKNLLNMAIFGPILRSQNPIEVGRINPREDLATVLEQGPKVLEKGRSLVIFPQSTRRPRFIPGEFNSLGIKLAKKVGVKIIPVAIKTDFWENGKMIKDLGPIRRHRPIYITFGQPLEINGNGKEEHRQIIDFIAGEFSQWEEKQNSDQIRNQEMQGDR